MATLVGAMAAAAGAGNLKLTMKRSPDAFAPPGLFVVDYPMRIEKK